MQLSYLPGVVGSSHRHRYVFRNAGGLAEHALDGRRDITGIVVVRYKYGDQRTGGRGAKLNGLEAPEEFRRATILFPLSSVYPAMSLGMRLLEPSSITRTRSHGGVG